MFPHLWHRKASWQISAFPSILCIGSSSQQTISSRCTPPQTPRWSQFPAQQTPKVKLSTYPGHTAVHMQMIRTRMYKALSELFLNSLMVAKTERMRQEKTNRKLKVKKKMFRTFFLLLFEKSSECYLFQHPQWYINTEKHTVWITDLHFLQVDFFFIKKMRIWMTADH